MRLKLRICLGFLPTCVLIAGIIAICAWLTQDILAKAERSREVSLVVARLSEQIKLDFAGIWQSFTEASAMREMAGGQAHGQEQGMAGMAGQSGSMGGMAGMETQGHAMPGMGSQSEGTADAGHGMPGMSGSAGGMAGMAAGGMSEGVKLALQRAQHIRTTMQGDTARLLEVFEAHGLAEHAATLRALESRFATFFEDARNMTLMHGTGHAMGAEHMAAFDARLKSLTADIDGFVSEQQRGVDLALGGITESASFLLQLIIIGGLVTLAVQIVISLTFTGLISRHVTVPVRRTIHSLTDTTGNVSRMADRLSLNGRELADVTSQEAASLEEASSTLEELAGMGNQTLEYTREATSLTETVSGQVLQGNEAVERLTASMRQLSDTSSQTAGIIKTIDEIAFQTNLLALNAAVEAARAGDAGKGFAVVAEEVRNLATRSAEAARETGDLLESAQQQVKQGVGVSTEVESSLREISNALEALVKLVEQVRAAQEEGAHGLTQLEQVVSQLSQGTQHNADMAEDAAEAGRTFQEQVAMFQDIVTDLMRLVGEAGGNGHGNAKTPLAQAALTTGNGHAARGAAPPRGRRAPDGTVPADEPEVAAEAERTESFKQSLAEHLLADQEDADAPEPPDFSTLTDKDFRPM